MLKFETASLAGAFKMLILGSHAEDSNIIGL